MTRSFPLAPMSRAIGVVTVFLFALPVILVVFGARSPTAQPLAWSGVFLAIIYASIWLFWRPHTFELSERELRIRFPMRTITIARSDLIAATLFPRGQELREQMGFAIRIGAGGILGGFGWLWTRKMGVVEFYVSRTDALVLLRRQSGRPLLITPARAREFHRALDLGVASNE